MYRYYKNIMLTLILVLILIRTVENKPNPRSKRRCAIYRRCKSNHDCCSRLICKKPNRKSKRYCMTKGMGAMILIG